MLKKEKLLCYINTAYYTNMITSCFYLQKVEKTGYTYIHARLYVYENTNYKDTTVCSNRINGHNAEEPSCHEQNLQHSGTPQWQDFPRVVHCILG